MGMYTGIRCKIIINEEFSPVIKTMMESDLRWDDLYEEFPQYEFLKQFGEGYRASFIPYGVLSYMPDEWETQPRKKDGSYDFDNFRATDDFERKFDPELRLWSFQCSLKNYDSDIQRFFEIVLPMITEKVIHLEYYYEEWTRSIFYELVDGEIVRSEKEGILYGYEEEESWY